MGGGGGGGAVTLRPLKAARNMLFLKFGILSSLSPELSEKLCFMLFRATILLTSYLFFQNCENFKFYYVL